MLLFGAFERVSKKLLLFPVERRDANTLIPLIQQHILPGTTIYIRTNGGLLAA